MTVSKETWVLGTSTRLLKSLKLIASAKDLMGIWEQCSSNEYQEHGLKAEQILGQILK